MYKLRKTVFLVLFFVLFCFLGVIRVYAEDTFPVVETTSYEDGSEITVAWIAGTVGYDNRGPNPGDPGLGDAAGAGWYQGWVGGIGAVWVHVGVAGLEIYVEKRPRCYGHWGDNAGTRVCPGACGKVTCTVEQSDGCGHDRTINDDTPGFNNCYPTISDWSSCDANHKTTRTCTDNDGLFFDLNDDGFATGSGEDADDCATTTTEKDCVGAIQGTLFDASDLDSCNIGSVGNAASLGVVATGGTVTYDGAYTVHTFNSSGVLSVSQSGLAEVLVVAGGGAGGVTKAEGGGGGGGGVVYRASQPIPVGNYSVSVGLGGPGAPVSREYRGSYGGGSSFMDLRAIGGGPGGGGGSSMGGSGGAGGGVKMQEDVGGGIGYGSNGGATEWLSGGGGGGAGEVGSNAVYLRAGDPETGSEGGDGFFSAISGTNKAYGGGGGGVRYRNSTYANLTTVAAGGAGGGGAGGTGNHYSSSRGIAPQAGEPNTGGGGGGCYVTCINGFGARGGSGVVIIRYLTRPLNQILPPELALPKTDNFPIIISGSWPLIDEPVTLDANGNYYEPVYASAVSPTYTFDYTELLNSDKVAGIKLQCQSEDVAVTQNNQVVTKDVGFWRVYGGWWQVTGGNVYAKDGVHSGVPASMLPQSNQKLILRNADGVSGVLSYGEPWVGLELGTNPRVAVSDDLWRIESAYEGLRYDYDFYNTKMDVFESTAWDGGSIDYNDGGVGYQIFKHSGNVTLNYSGPTGTQKVILLVNGNVTIDNDIVVPPGAYFSIIAKGNITFSRTVAKAQGWFIGENINVPCTDVVAPANECDRTDIQFEGEGSFVGWSGINMARDRFKTNNQEPSEKFAYRSDMLLNIPTPMKVYTKRFSPFVP